MPLSLEVELTPLSVTSPVSNLGLLSVVGGGNILQVPTGTNDLELTDGTNSSIVSNVLTSMDTIVIRFIFDVTTMQISVDGVAIDPVPFDGAIDSGNLELVRDGGFAVKNISIYDEALPYPWIGYPVATPVAMAEQSHVGYPAAGQVGYPVASFLDVEPNQFTLPADVTDAEPGALIEFSFPVAGTDAGAQAPFVSTNCQISTDNINFFNNLDAVLGQTIYGRAYAPVNFQTEITYTVTSGSVSDSFTITTETAIAVPMADSANVGYPSAGQVGYPIAQGVYFPDLGQGWDFVELVESGEGEGYIEVTPDLEPGDLIAFSDADDIAVMDDASIVIFNELLESFDYKVLKGDVVSGPFTYAVTVQEPDGILPVITVTGGTTEMTQGGVYTPPTVTATDNIDGDITADIVVTGSVDVNTLGSQTVTYNVIDSAGNAALTASHTVVVSAAVDSVIPVITVSGGTTTMVEGGTYTPPTVTALDDVDGDITGSIVQTGTIDVNAVGTQTVYFDVQDAAGNSAVQASHTVVVTPIPDSTPNQFTFAPISNAPRNKYIESDFIDVLGINVPVPISIVGGEYAISGGEFTSDPGTVVNGDDVLIEVLTPGSYNEPVSATLTIGTVQSTFTVTTEEYVPNDSTPTQFNFVDQTDVALGQPIESAAITVLGIDIASPISVAGGEYSVNGGAYTSAAGTVSVNDTVRARVTSSAINSTAVSATVTIGGISDVFTVTTIEAVLAPDIILGGDNDVLPDEVATLSSQLFNHSSSTLAFLDSGTEKYPLEYVSDGVVRVPSHAPSGTYTLVVRELSNG